MFIISTIFISSVFCADVRIEDVLPDTTIAIVSIENAEELSKKLNEMGVYDSVCQFAEVMTDNVDEFGLSKFAQECQNLLDVIGLQKDGVPGFPSGRMEGAIYPVVDYEMGSVGIGIFAMVELGESKWTNIINDSLTDVATEMELNIEEVDLAGHTVWRISGVFPRELSSTDMQINTRDFEQIYIVIYEGYLVLGNEPDVVATALSVIDGDDEANSLANSDLYAELRERSKDREDVYLAVLMTNLADTIMQMDETGTAMFALPMLKSFIGDVDGIAESVSFSSSDTATLEANYTIYMGDGRNGMLGLISDKVAEESIPAYVSEETLSYAQLQIDMDKVVPFFMETISNNDFLAMQLGAQTEEIEKTLQKFFAHLGTEVHIVSSGYLPIAADSLGYLVAIECTDEEAFSEFLSTMMQNRGVDPTDFLGYQMYTADFGGGMMMPIDLSISLSVGGGYVFMGTTRPVEQALRAIANPGESKGNREKNVALSLLSMTDATGWGYADTAKSIEFQQQLMRGISEDMFADMEDFDPEMAAEMRNEFKDNRKQQEAIMQIFSGFFGPTSWSLNTDENGFNAHAVMLQP